MIEAIEAELETLYDVEMRIYQYNTWDKTFNDQKLIDEVEKHIEYFDVEKRDIHDLDPIREYTKTLVKDLLENGISSIKVYKLKEGMHVLDLPVSLLNAVIYYIGAEDLGHSFICEELGYILKSRQEIASLNKTIEEMVRVIAELGDIIKTQ